MSDTNTKKVRKPLALIISLSLILVVAIVGTIAYLQTQTTEVKNTFEPGKVSCAINETFENNVKTNVTVTNTGNTDAFIRAAVVVTWQDGNGNVYRTKPVAGTDYSIEFGSDWTLNGDYYYYNAAVAPSAATTNLIVTAQPLVAGPAGGYTLHIEILADAIQSSPTDAAQEAWGYVPGSN